MRLPTDAALIVIDEASAGVLIEVWREERLPLFQPGAKPGGAFADGELEAALDAIGATTLVICGTAFDDPTLQAATSLGYRVFLLGDEPGAFDIGGEAARVATLEMALAAARRARARERWKAARRA